MAGARKLLVPAAVGLGLLPLARLVLDAARGGLGANPIAEALNRLGFWTLTLLAATLAATPLSRLLGLAWPARIRRSLGLLTFGYAFLHLVTYAGVDQFLDLAAIGADVVKRPFITVGLAAFLLLVPLAATSTDGWVRRLGYRRWKALHRLTYAAALAALLHFVWRVKIDLRKPLLFAAIIGVLLLLRLVPRRARQGAPAAPRGPAPEPRRGA